MSVIDSLPPDQRAVLQLVLQRDRGYDDIAAMLSIDRAAVRQRALDALDALGPENAIPPLERSLVTDYLLGQLPPRVAEQVNGRLVGSAEQNAWAQAVADSLASIGRGSRGEVPAFSPPQVEPAEPGYAPPEPRSGEPALDADLQAAIPESDELAAPLDSEAYDAERGLPPAGQELEEATRFRPQPYAPAGAAARPPGGASRPPISPRSSDVGPTAAGRRRPGAPVAERRPPTSRRGGAVLLGVLALVVVAGVVVAILATGGSSPKHSPGSTTSTQTTTSAGNQAKLLATIELSSPSGATNTIGVAQVIRAGRQLGVVIAASGLPANSHANAYAVWLYNSPTSSFRVGFVNTRVTHSGRLETDGPLPANASSYHQIYLTLETQANPKQPGKVILRGQFKS